jgi:hypothetical protein
MGYCLGLSLRDLQESRHRSLGEILSLEALDRVLVGLEGRVTAFKTARLPNPPPIVLVDGLWVKIAYPTGEIKVDAQGRRRAAKRQQQRVVLTALGVWPDGHWAMLHWKVAPGETAEAWDACVGELSAKGRHRGDHPAGRQRWRQRARQRARSAPLWRSAPTRSLPYEQTPG